MIDRPDVKVTVHEEGGSMFFRMEFNGKTGWALVMPNGDVIPQKEKREDELDKAYAESRAQVDTAP